MIVTHKIEMDLVKRCGTPCINVVQGDCNSRMVELSLLADGTDWEVPSGTHVRVRYRKPDGTGGSFSTLPDGTQAWSISGNRVFVYLVPRMLAVPGCVFAQVELTQGENTIATFTFQIVVERDPALGYVETDTEETANLIPIPSEGDHGRYLRVVDGAAKWVEGENAKVLIGDLEALDTGEKENLVAAVNELAAGQSRISSILGDVEPTEKVVLAGKDTWIAGYLTDVGTFNTTAGGYHTDYLPLSYDEIYVTTSERYACRAFAVYDESKTFLGLIRDDGSTAAKDWKDVCVTKSEILALYPTAAYFVVGYYPIGTNLFEVYAYKQNTLPEMVDTAARSGNVLYGKKWAVCGDSVTAGAGVSALNSDGVKDTYQYFIGKRNAMTVVTDGIGGSTMALTTEYLTDPENYAIDNRSPFAYERYKNVPLDADYITLWFGINDSSHTNLGTIDDESNETWYGAWNVVLKYFIENAPLAHIGIIVTHGGKLTYRDAVREIGKKYGVKVFDIMGDENTPYWHSRESTLSQPDAAVAALRRAAWWTDDSHPNSTGYQYISGALESWLRTL